MSASIAQDSIGLAVRLDSVTRVSRWTYFGAMLAAFCLGTVMYWPSLAGPRLFDDDIMLSDVDQTETITAIVSTLQWLRPETRPVVRLTFGIEALLFGDSMSVHRLGNVVIHVFAATALFGLVRRVFQQIESGLTFSGFSAADQTALAVSILWFVHPLQSAAVAYVAQRGESFMGLFFFAYLRCVVELITTQKSRWLLAAIIVFALGLFSKTIMITAPMVGLLLDRAFFSRTWKEVIRGQWRLMLFPAAGSALAVILLLPGILKGDANVGFGGDAPPMDVHLAAQAKILWLYAFQCVWPQWLSVDHAMRPPQYIADNLGWILLSSVFLVSIGALYWYRKQSAGFLLLAPLCVLAVTSSVIPTADLWVDHRMYVPLACAMTVMVVGIRKMLTLIHGPVQSARILPVLVGLICLLFSVRTWSRAGDYGSRVQIWRSAAAENPDNDRALQNLIDATRKESPGQSMIPVLQETLRVAEQTNIVPTVALGRLGEQYAELGDSDKAMSLLTRAFMLDDQYFFEGYRGPKRNAERFGMHVNMCLALASVGRLSEALEHVNQAFLFADGSADARALAGSLSLQVGDIEAAEDHFQRALELRPGWKDVEADLERIRQLQ
jgi:hypothetical protein